MILFFIFISNIISLGLPSVKPLVIERNDTVQVENSTFDLTPHTNFGNCSCDISRNCDPYCCCDPDCSGVSFPYCLDSPSMSSKLRLCSSQENEGGGKVIEWFLRTSLCIQRDNNPSPGSFYDLDFNDFSQNDGEDIESNPSSLNNIFTLDSTNNNDDGVHPFSVVEGVRIPRLSSNGSCQLKPMLYLESVDEYCSSPEKNTSLQNYTFDNLSYCNGNFSCIRQNTQIDSESFSNVHIVVKWGQKPQSMSPTGYHFGETITDRNGKDIKLGKICTTQNWNNFSIEFGKQTDILCDIKERDDVFQTCGNEEENYTCLNFSNTSIIFLHTNYSTSPFSNNIENNYGEIRQEIPDVLNLGEEEYPHLMITQSLSIIYKSIGPIENPQHIISDFKVNYFTAKSIHNLLRMVVRFYEQPNELNIFDNPDMSDVYQWLPF